MRTDWEGKLNSKKDFQELLFAMLDPLVPYYSQEKAELDLGVTATTYDHHAIRLEAFSWRLFGQAAGTARSLKRFTKKGWRQGQTHRGRNIGAGSAILTSAL